MSRVSPFAPPDSGTFLPYRAGELRRFALQLLRHGLCFVGRQRNRQSWHIRNHVRMAFLMFPHFISSPFEIRLVFSSIALGFRMVVRQTFEQLVPRPLFGLPRLFQQELSSVQLIANTISNLYPAFSPLSSFRHL